MTPTTRYADSGGHAIAYQVVGDGPVDVVFIPGLVSHLDLQWHDPVFSHFLESLASFSRLVILDHRGVGLSDPAASIPTLSERMDDVRAVMREAGSRHAYLLGHCNGGPVALLQAATYPEEVAGLVLCATFVKGRPDESHPGALSEAAVEAASEAAANWGEGRSLELFNPSRARGGLHRRAYAEFERAALSPGLAKVAFTSTLEIDVTGVVGSVQAPTLVVHCTGDFMAVEGGRHLAASIPGATFVELPGSDHAPFAGDGSEELIDLIRRFVTGETGEPGGGSSRFGTVLITDIVDSTRHLASLEDRRWRSMMAVHDVDVRDAIDQHGGDYVKSTGDGFLATFGTPEDALRCSDAIARATQDLGMDVRVALHAGSYQQLGRDIAGMTVVVAARLLGVAGPNEVVVSSTVRQLAAGSEFRFHDHGLHRLKGVGGIWPAFALDDDSVGGPRPAAWTTQPEPVPALGVPAWSAP